MALGFDMGGIGSSAMGWASSLLFWGIGFIVLCVVIIGLLVFKRKLKFTYPCVEIVGLGQGKVSIYTTKAGWFKKKRIFFNLIETGGEQELICKDKSRKIFNVSSTDYHEINGKRGILCKRKDDDPEVLVPLNRVEISNLKLIMNIAPADFRDAAVDILEEKRKETMGWLEKNAPVIVAITVFMFGIIALIIVFNFAKGESTAWREYAMAAKSGAQVVTSAVAP